ncbi:MAG: hypothetical protein R2771_05960 [Saprospiraceae bacterium]
MAQIMQLPIVSIMSVGNGPLLKKVMEVINYITIKHISRYTTTYLHMSKLQKVFIKAQGG